MSSSATTDRPTSRLVPGHHQVRQETNGARPHGSRPHTNGAAMVEADHVDERKLLEVLTALRKGNFTPRLPAKWTGMAGKVADTVNEVMELNQRMAKELERLARLVGKEGKIGHRASLVDFTGQWATSVDSINTLVGDLLHPTNEMARATALDFDGRSLQGEFLRTAKIVNRMVDQLGSFTSEVTRVVREVGTEGKLGGHARVEGV